MLSAKKIIRLIPIICSMGFVQSVTAQINSPFSRYGLGNEIQISQNATSQAMGGFTAAYTASMNGSFGQSINFNNPASFGTIYMTTFDLGVNFTNTKLKQESTNKQEKSNYLIPNYLVIGVPLSKEKKMGMAFGLRPLTQVNYSINELKLVSSTGDTLYNNYVGSGGLNQVFLGLGKSWKNISVGFSTGVNFGRKKIQNIKSLDYNSDSTYLYQTMASTNTVYGGVFLNLGILGETTLKSKTHAKTTDKTEYSLSYGATATLDQNMSAKQDVLRTTGIFTSTTENAIDTAYYGKELPGKIKMPALITTGIALHKKEISNRGTYDQWVIGIQYDKSAWKDKYSNYGTTDPLSNAWMMRVGVQFCPNPFDYENYFSTVTYRAGYYTGKDYINFDNKGLTVSAFTLGMGLPIRKYRSYDYQFTVLNLALQMGQRGSSVNDFKESFIQFTLGYSLSDIWFNKRKYD
ncbi:MAG: hypothetical protein RL064_1000 [Bacteroidota bacterium]